MTVQAYTPDSWAGTAIDGTGNVRCFFMDANSPVSGTRPLDPVEAQIPGLGDRYVRGQPKGVFLEMHARLNAYQEADVQAFYKVFDESRGLDYLRAKDGAGVILRVQAAITTIRRVPGARGYYIIVLRVPDPRWEEDTATTDSKLAQSGASIALSLTNAGNRDARPAFTITPNTAKTAGIDDYKYSFRGVLVNPAPRAINNLPGYLFDQSGVAARLDTTTLVKDTTISNLINNAAGITAAATVIDYDTPAGGGLAAAGMAWIETEQISYTGKSGTQLTGVVRGIGGTTAAAHADNTPVYQSNALANGDDLRVWIDDVEAERWLVGWNSAATDVVVNLSLPRAVQRTLTAAIGVTDTSFEFAEGVQGLASRGFLLIDNEMIWYDALTARGVTGVVRGVRGTTAAAHTTAAAVWANPKSVVVAVGKAKAGPPPSTAAHRPCIQLPGSSNQTWKWGDGADDPNTVFVDSANPDRTAQWAPGLDGNIDPLSGSTVLVQSDTQATFQDADPASVAGLAANTLQVAAPYDIANQVAQITYDAALDPALALRIYGERAGRSLLLKELVGSAAMGAQQIDSIASLAGALKVAVVHGVVTGIETGDYGTAVATDTLPLAQTFTLTAQEVVTRLAVRAQRNGTSDLKVDLCPTGTASGGATFIDATNKLMNTATIPNASLPVAMGWVFIDISASPVTLAAGKYGLVFTASAAGGSVTLSRSNGSVIADGEARVGVPAGLATKTIKTDWDAWCNAAGTGNATSADLSVDTSSGAEKWPVWRFPLADIPSAALTKVQLTVALSVNAGGLEVADVIAFGNSTGYYGTDDPALMTNADLYYRRITGGGRSTYALSGVNFGNATPAGTVATIDLPQGTPNYAVTDVKAACQFGRFSLALGPNATYGIVTSLAAIEHATYPEATLILTFQEAPATAFQTILGYDLGVRVYGSPVQATSLARTDGQTAVGKIAVVWDAATRLYVHRLSGFVAGGLYHCTGVITSTTTGEQIAVDRWMELGASLAIDCDARSASYTEGGVVYPASSSLAPLTPGEWMRLAPGANALTYSEAGMASTDLLTAWRGMRV